MIESKRKEANLIEDKHHKKTEWQWVEWKAGNQIERRSGIHCTAASESNKGEQEQRKWKAEREMGKCWNKGSDEKRGGLWKRASECVARFNDGAALNSAVNTTTCTFSFMSFLSVPPRACSFVSPCVHQQYGLCYIIYQYCFFVSWVHINTILLDWKGNWWQQIGPVFVSCSVKVILHDI